MNELQQLVGWVNTGFENANSCVLQMHIETGEA